MEKEEPGQEKSYHIFLFPFKWDYKAFETHLENTDFEKRIDLEKFAGVLTGSHWQRESFKINEMEIPGYNELVYFYDFVRDALFDFGKGKEAIHHHYEYPVLKDAKYKIHVKKKNEPYVLDIDKIMLDVYNTGVAILSYHLRNTVYSKLEDILLINDYGRRVYPQFLDKGNYTGRTKGTFLADKIEVIFNEETLRDVDEDFSYFKDIEKIRQNPYKLSASITGLLGDRFVTRKEDAGTGDIFIEPVVDDRMFVLCWFADDKLCAKLAKYEKKKESYKYTTNDDWYKFIFIDTDSTTCKSIPMKEQFLKDHTYDRWIDKKYGTLFGFCRYSFVVLTSEPDKNEIDNLLPLQHLKSMYFRMVKLALVQRASILRFSNEVTRISELKETKDTTKRISRLHESYIRFVNKVYFREVTAQEQGIELYDRVARVMKIERDVKDLNREIDELHQYASLIEDKRNNDQLYRLTILGALFIIPAFLSGFFGMNIFSGKMAVTSLPKYRLIIGAIFITPLLTFLWFSCSDRWKMKGSRLSLLKRIFLIFIPILILLMLLILVFSFDTFFAGVTP